MDHLLFGVWVLRSQQLVHSRGYPSSSQNERLRLGAIRRANRVVELRLHHPGRVDLNILEEITPTVQIRLTESSSAYVLGAVAGGMRGRARPLFLVPVVRESIFKYSRIEVEAYWIECGPVCYM